MEEKDKNVEKEEKGSNSCVMDLSIDGDEKEHNNKDKDNDNDNEGNTMILNKSFDDVSNFTKKLNLKDNFENILDLADEDLCEDDNEKTRSKTFVIKNSGLKDS